MWAIVLEWRPCCRCLLVSFCMFRRIAFRPVVKKKTRERGDFANCLSLGSVSFVLFRRMYFITLDYHSLSEKLVAALLCNGSARLKQKVIYSPVTAQRGGRIYISHAPSFQVNNPLTYPLRIRQLVKKIWFSHTSWFYVGRRNILTCRLVCDDFQQVWQDKSMSSHIWHY